jgi:hypothetical protein
MSYTDSQLKTLATVEALKHECNLMVNVRGKFYAGRQLKNIPGWLIGSIKKIITERFCILLSPTRVETGLMPGASDNIGITTITITPDMIGQKIGVFTAIENKSIRDRWQKGQQEFLQMVADAGGIAAEHREIVENSQVEYRFFSPGNGDPVREW